MWDNDPLIYCTWSQAFYLILFYFYLAKPGELEPSSSESSPPGVHTSSRPPCPLKVGGFCKQNLGYDVKSQLQPHAQTRLVVLPPLGIPEWGTVVRHASTPQLKLGRFPRNNQSDREYIPASTVATSEIRTVWVQGCQLSFGLVTLLGSPFDISKKVKQKWLWEIHDPPKTILLFFSLFLIIFYFLQYK